MMETAIDSIPTVFQELRTSFKAGKTKPLAWRKKQLEQLYKMCDEQKHVFASAAYADFRRPTAETLLFDCGVVS